MTRKARIGWLIAGGLLTYGTLEAFLRFGYKFLEEKIYHPLAPWHPYLVDELTGSYAWLLLVPLLFLFIRRFRLQRHNWWWRLPILASGAVASSALHTLLMWGSREILYPLTGLGEFDYGSMALRFPMEFFNQVIGYFMFALLVHAFLYYLDTRDREVQTARLQAELSEARLRSLQARLHPHFLFNTLNMITSSMYSDVEVADRMMSRLSDVLRLTLDAPPDQEVPLEEELELLRLYLEIMEARFGNRVQVHLDIDEESRAGLVPTMLLQPLVENAFQHGILKKSGQGAIRVSAKRVDERLALEVIDDGPGMAEDPDEALRAGIGLSTTADRLEQLYGGASELRLANLEPTGLSVQIEIPFRRSADDETRPATELRLGAAASASAACQET
ncbi:MAG: histidine kinase [Gemmatimonadota bacterium]|nr:MAG: histidine kinase [Gemmatimonadota bacterium]